MKAVIRPMEPADAPGVAKLRTLVYPHHPEAYYADWHDSVWSWLETHPLSGDMERWVVAAGDEVVGHLAAIPQYYRVNGERAVAHTPADYQVLPQHGFQALSLMRKFFRTVENCVACDMVPAVITLETRMGAVVAGDLQYRAKLLDVSRLPSPSLDDARALLGRDGDGPAEPPRPEDAHPNRPRAPIPAPARVLMNRSLRVIDGTLGAAFVGNGTTVETVESFDPSFDRLFDAVAGAIPCLAEKDAAFLRWRYGPGSPQHPVTVLGVRGGETLLGYAVLRVTREGMDGYILDLTTLPGRHDVARALLREAVRRFRRAGVQILRYRFLDAPTAPRSEDLWKLGFFPRDNRRNTLLVKFADPDLQGAAKDIDNWTYCVGDGESTFWVR